VSGRDFFVQGDEIGIFPEPELNRAIFAADGFTVEALDAPGVGEYLVGDIPNRFLPREH